MVVETDHPVLGPAPDAGIADQDERDAGRRQAGARRSLASTPRTCSSEFGLGAEEIAGLRRYGADFRRGSAVQTSRELCVPTWLLSDGGAPTDAIRLDLLSECHRQHFGKVQRPAAGRLTICSRQLKPSATISVSGDARAHGRQQDALADRLRHGVFLGLESERARHAAAAGVRATARRRPSSAAATLHGPSS